MKITDFLKKYSLIDSKFIIDFYSFYDEGKNEFDFTIKDITTHCRSEIEKALDQLDYLEFQIKSQKDKIRNLIDASTNTNINNVVCKWNIKTFHLLL